jgi:hypothetical protein
MDDPGNLLDDHSGFSLGDAALGLEVLSESISFAVLKNDTNGSF